MSVAQGAGRGVGAHRLRERLSGETRMDQLSLPQYIRYLLEPASYPHPVQRVRLVQTHVSYLLFAGDFVYKWKKPVNFGFLDFSTLEQRRYFCEEEVRLNRRLCADMYLGVVRLARGNGGLALDGDGECLEYGVKMRRLPGERMMDRMIAAKTVRKEHLDRVIDQLVPFYAATAEMTGGSSGYGSVAAVGKTIRDNFAETRRFVGSPALASGRFARIREYAEAFLAKEDVFRQRKAAGRIRDCHGDLHSANICLTEPVHIFDCLEFNESLRCTDVAADVAFLAMDLDFHDLRGLGAHFVDRFIDRSGDAGLFGVLDFYKCYRAFVRGKIGLLTAADPGVGREGAAAALSAAKRYFRLAEEYGER